MQNVKHKTNFIENTNLQIHLKCSKKKQPISYL